MTLAQHAQLQNIFRHFETLQPEDIEEAFIRVWKPFIETLPAEEDRALSFKLFYDWQTTQMNNFLDILQVESPQANAA
jgi:hypothetical protein